MPEILWDTNLYEKQHRFVSNYGLDALQWLEPKAGERILDVGCGTGHLTAQIAESRAQVTGTDASEEMIAQASASYPHLQFETVNGTKLPYSESFDAIFSNATFHWIENQDALAEGLFRSLKPGGRLVAEFGGQGNIKTITDAIAVAAGQLNLAEKIASGFWFFPSIGQYTALLESKGFEVEQAWLFNRPTKLEGVQGMYNWINQFASYAFKNLTENEAESVKQRALQILEPNCFINGEWVADYRRIRVKAWKL